MASNLVKPIADTKQRDKNELKVNLFMDGIKQDAHNEKNEEDFIQIIKRRNSKSRDQDESGNEKQWHINSAKLRTGLWNTNVPQDR